MPQTMENSLPHFWKIKCLFLWKSTCRLHGNIVLVFNREISAVDYVMSNPETETWNAFSGSNYVKDGNKLTVKGEQYLNALRNSASGRSRCVIVSFKDSEKYCSFTFTATPINP